MHAMNVKTKYYRLLKSGEKVIELRLFDEKRRKIKVGDTIAFSDAADSSDHFKAVVVALHQAGNFDQLCDRIQPMRAGFDTKRELVAALGEFYDAAAQEKFGVVGIEVKKI